MVIANILPSPILAKIHVSNIKQYLYIYHTIIYSEQKFKENKEK